MARLVALGFVVLSAFFRASAAPPEWFSDLVNEVRLTFSEGRNDLHLSGFYWHAPSTYSAEARRELNDSGTGLGMGRSRLDGKGNEHALVISVSRSSYYKSQYMAGYLWQARWPAGAGMSTGMGYAAFLFSRSDFNHYLPLPGLVPTLSVAWSQGTVYVAYLPSLRTGKNSFGNVFYLFARVRM